MFGMKQTSSIKIQCDVCNEWVHTGCNNLNRYTYSILQKDKAPWYCLYCLKREMSHSSLTDNNLQDLIHGKIILSPNKAIASSVVRESEIFKEEPFSNVNNDFYTATEFCDKYSKINTRNNLHTP